MKSKKEQKKININGKPKYINLGTDYNFFELFQKIQLNFVNCFLSWSEKPKAVDASSRLPGSILSCSLHANRIFKTKKMRKINRNKFLHSRDLNQ